MSVKVRDSEVSGALQTFVGQQVSGNFTGEVVSVDKNNASIVVKFNENQYTAKLRSIINGSAVGMVPYPAEGSQVFCVAEGNSKNRFIAIGFEEIEELSYTEGDTTLTINADGYDVKRGGESLFKIMDDLLTAILNMKFTTNMGPTIALVNTPEFQGIQKRIPNLLIK